MGEEEVTTLKAVRECGECRLCCKIMGVPELDKPMNVWCKHVCNTGCSIYEKRPQSCRDFVCVWLGGLTPEKERPDKVKVVGWIQRIPDTENGVLTVVFAEAAPGAAAKKQVQTYIAMMMDEGTPVAIIPFGSNTRRLYCTKGHKLEVALSKALKDDPDFLKNMNIEMYIAKKIGG